MQLFTAGGLAGANKTRYTEKAPRQALNEFLPRGMGEGREGRAEHGRPGRRGGQGMHDRAGRGLAGCPDSIACMSWHWTVEVRCGPLLLDLLGAACRGRMDSGKGRAGTCWTARPAGALRVFRLTDPAAPAAKPWETLPRAASAPALAGAGGVLLCVPCPFVRHSAA